VQITFCVFQDSGKDEWRHIGRKWRRLHNGELRNLYAGHVAHMGEMRNVYKVLVGKPKGNRLLGRSTCRVGKGKR
jgi:hypothetical protein